MVCWSLTPGVFQVPISSSHRVGLQARLLGQLAPRRGLRCLAALVACPRRQLQHHGVDRRPVLAHQCHGAVVVQGDDGDCTGVAEDDALEGRAPGIEQVDAVDPEQPRPEELLLRDAAEARHAPLR